MTYAVIINFFTSLELEMSKKINVHIKQAVALWECEIKNENSLKNISIIFHKIDLRQSSPFNLSILSS